MPDSPPDTLINKAKQLADLKGKPLYLYKTTGGWCLSESLSAISGCTGILEIRPDTYDNDETGNFGGC